MRHRNVRIAAVIVTYYPDEGLLKRTLKVLEQVDEVLVIDNGSPFQFDAALEEIANVENIIFIKNPQNEGIAAALNKGLTVLLELGYTRAVTFDQDSEPLAHMVSIQLALIESAQNMNGIAIVAPDIVDPNVSQEGEQWVIRRSNTALPNYKWVRCDKEPSLDVDFVITSGSLLNLNVYQAVGPFRNEFFIDYVDTEYCIRARLAGYRVVVACGAKLKHNLGSSVETKLLWFRVTPTNHSALRQYYISRNRIMMYKMYARKLPHWFVYDVQTSIKWWIKILLCEENKIRKVLMIIRGTWDGIRGRMGAYSR